MKLFSARLMPLLLCVVLPAAAVAEGAPITYQGRLLADGAPVANGDYTLSIELFADASASERICGDSHVVVSVVGGYFAHTLQDSSCRQVLLAHHDEVHVRVLARGGPFGERDVEVGMHPISAGVFALHAVSGGGAVGDIVASMLTPEQFQAVRGPGWALADGGSYPESLYAEVTGRTSVPDLRGVFLRGRDHGRINSDGRGNPEGNLELGAYQGDAVGSHDHGVRIGILDREGNESRPVLRVDFEDEEEVHETTTSATGGEETRPRSVTVNYFIRID